MYGEQRPIIKPFLKCNCLIKYYGVIHNVLIDLFALKDLCLDRPNKNKPVCSPGIADYT